MNIILSIHPKWAKLIYEGKKTVEYRKSIPKYENAITVYMYETSPIRKVTGCFTIQELRHYQNDSKDVVGWVVGSFEKFDQPKTIADFGLKRPPQSWCYTEVDV